MSGCLSVHLCGPSELLLLHSPSESFFPSWIALSMNHSSPSPLGSRNGSGLCHRILSVLLPLEETCFWKIRMSVLKRNINGLDSKLFPVMTQEACMFSDRCTGLTPAYFTSLLSIARCVPREFSPSCHRVIIR